jgi:hypothetical protein
MQAECTLRKNRYHSNCLIIWHQNWLCAMTVKIKSKIIQFYWPDLTDFPAHALVQAAGHSHVKRPPPFRSQLPRILEFEICNCKFFVLCFGAGNVSFFHRLTNLLLCCLSWTSPGRRPGSPGPGSTPDFWRGIFRRREVDEHSNIKF